MLQFYSSFPREIAFPQRKMVYSLDEFLSEINKYNGIKEVYTSVYSFSEIKDGKPDYESGIIDKVFFDFDGENAFLDACTLHEHLTAQNIRHLFVFSGRGYHIYVRTKNFESLKNKKAALLNTHNYFERLLNIKIDEKIKGDIARVSRVINTWNTRGKRYSIPITDDDLHEGEVAIREKAKKQYLNQVMPWFGKNLYDISQHDGEKPREVELLQIDTMTRRKIDSDELLTKLPECVSSILAREHLGWKGRYLVIVYLHEYGYSRLEIIEIMSKYCTKEEMDHCLRSEKQLDYLIQRLRRGNLMFPNCETIRGQGGCPFKKDCSKSRLLYK